MENTSTSATKRPTTMRARLFIDFFLSDESLNIMAKEGEFVTRAGIYPPLPDADKIRFVSMDEFASKDYAPLKTAI